MNVSLQHEASRYRLSLTGKSRSPFDGQVLAKREADEVALDDVLQLLESIGIWRIQAQPKPAILCQELTMPD